MQGLSSQAKTSFKLRPVHLATYAKPHAAPLIYLSVMFASHHAHGPSRLELSRIRVQLHMDADLPSSLNALSDFSWFSPSAMRRLVPLLSLLVHPECFCFCFTKTTSWDRRRTNQYSWLDQEHHARESSTRCYGTFMKCSRFHSLMCCFPSYDSCVLW